MESLKIDSLKFPVVALLVHLMMGRHTSIPYFPRPPQLHLSQLNMASITPTNTPPKPRQCLRWSRVRSLPGNTPSPRSGTASVVACGKLFVFGGYGGGVGRLDDFHSYDFETGRWEEIEVLSEEKPTGRENNGLIIGNSDATSIYLFGGYNGSIWLNDLWEYSIESNEWTCIQDHSDPIREVDVSATGDAQGSSPCGRFGCVSVMHQGKLIVWGGFDGTRWLDDMYEFDFETEVWTEIVTARGAVAPSGRSCPAFAKNSTHLYIQGGYDGTERKADFFTFDLNTYTWTKMPCLGTPPSARYFHSCCLYQEGPENKLYLYGGYSGSQRLADMYVYDMDTHHWSSIAVDSTATNTPSGRSTFLAQVHGNSLYIFGGYNGFDVMNDFYKFRLKSVHVPPTALVQDFSKLLNSPDLADIRFVVEGKTVYAHRTVLAIRSEYFRAMLCGGMSESSDVASVDKNEILIQDVSYDAFLKVMEFLYTDGVKDLSLEMGIYLLVASERFMLDRLKALCEDMILKNIDTDNVIDVLVAGHWNNAECLKDSALEFILCNITDARVMAGMNDLRDEPDLLLEIIKRNPMVHAHTQAATVASPSRRRTAKCECAWRPTSPHHHDMASSSRRSRSNHKPSPKRRCCRCPNCGLRTRSVVSPVLVSGATGSIWRTSDGSVSMGHSAQYVRRRNQGSSSPAFSV